MDLGSPAVAILSASAYAGTGGFPLLAAARVNDSMSLCRQRLSRSMQLDELTGRFDGPDEEVDQCCVGHGQRETD